LTEQSGAVLRLTLNRPHVRNAFDEEVIAALTAAAKETAANPTLRAIVIAGSGSSFCAGADLAWMAKAILYSREENRRDAEDLARLLELLDSLPVPLIARVHGAALGGGVGLVAVSDVVIAADDAVFGFTETKPSSRRTFWGRLARLRRGSCFSPARGSRPSEPSESASCTASSRTTRSTGRSMNASARS
jgi:enoyl-CoA hydratase/carnithine racemase